MNALLAAIKRLPHSAGRSDKMADLLEQLVRHLQETATSMLEAFEVLGSRVDQLQALAIATSERLAELEQQLSAPVTIGVSFEDKDPTCP